MASFPVDARYETRLSGSTVIKSAWANASDDALNGAIGGSKTITRLTVDGLGGFASGLAASGAISAMGEIRTSSGDVRGIHFVSPATVTIDGGNGAGATPGFSGSIYGVHGGRINVEISTSASGNAAVATVNFALPFPSGSPKGVSLTPGNAATAQTTSGGANGLVYVSDINSGGFTLFNGSTLPLASGRAYSWFYTVAG